MMGLCYCCNLVTLRIFFLITVAIMNFQAALLVTLVGIVASAPISDKLDIMNKDTIEQAHSLINKILQDIPTTHAAWIKSKSLTLGDSKARLELEFLKKDMYIPSAPVLQLISNNFSMLQNQAGFDPSKQASDEESQTPEHDLAKRLTNEYLTQVAAHLTLQQLQDFSCDILRSIHSMTSSLAENPNTVQLCVNKAGL
ncbi:hypothetical protein cypCar_00047478 [Cyprinus carpio]|nr:hypothetical protein cypCar_00047478 [Cyprinus carpio]